MAKMLAPATGADGQSTACAPDPLSVSRTETVGCANSTEADLAQANATAQLIEVGITPEQVAGIVEAARMQRIIELDAKIASLKLERECLASQVRNQMSRDGVVRHKIPGIGTATLQPGRPLHSCDNCASAIGDAKRDPYLKVVAE